MKVKRGTNSSCGHPCCTLSKRPVQTRYDLSTRRGGVGQPRSVAGFQHAAHPLRCGSFHASWGRFTAPLFAVNGRKSGPSQPNSMMNDAMTVPPDLAGARGRGQCKRDSAGKRNCSGVGGGESCRGEKKKRAPRTKGRAVDTPVDRPTAVPRKCGTWWWCRDAGRQTHCCATEVWHVVVV